MIYIVTFVLSLLIAYLAYKFPRESILRKLLIIVSMLIPCFLAAFRSCNIGTDVGVYAEKWFKLAINTASFSTFYDEINTPDILYALITYLTAKTGCKIWLLFLVAQLFTIVPIVYVAQKTENSKQYVICLAIYYLFFYNISLNLMRQSISLSFSLLSFYFLSENKTKRYLLFTIIAMFFHFSGILGLVFYVTSKIKTKKAKQMYVIISCVIAILVIVFFRETIELLYSIGVTPERFLVYTSKFYRLRIAIPYERELYFAMIVAVSLMCAGNNKNIKLLSIVGFLLFQVGLVSNFAYRISYIFFYPALFIQIPEYMASKTAKNAKILLLILMSSMFLYWTHQIIILGIHETYPYELGINY